MSDVKEAIRVLSQPEGPLEAWDKAVSFLRDKVDVFHTAEYVNYVKVVPGLCALLQSLVPVSLQPNSLEHLVRNKVLELILRLPSNDQLRQYVPDLLRTLTFVAVNDNEENSALALKVLVIYHKALRAGAEEEAKQLVVFAIQVFNNMSVSVTEMLNDGYDSVTVSAAAGFGPGIGIEAPAKAAVAAIDSGAIPRNPDSERDQRLMDAAIGKALCPAAFSFRVAIELPGPILLVLQLYASLTSEYFEASFHSMLGFLRLASLPDLRSLARGSIPSKASSPAIAIITPDKSSSNNHASSSQGQHGGEHASDGSSSAAAGDSADAARSAAAEAKARTTRQLEFVAAQVKVVAIPGWMLKFNNRLHLLKNNEAVVGPAIFRILGTIPPEAPHLRREVLSILLLFVKTECRSAFLRDIDTLLDRRVILGTIYLQGPATDAVRMQAYHALADFFHFVRDQITVNNVAAIVDFFCPVIMDITVPQTLCAVALRLLYNMVEFLMHSQEVNKSRARAIISLIFNQMVAKLGSLRSYIPRALAAERRQKADEEREKSNRQRQTERISAASELVAIQQRAKQTGSGPVLDAEVAHQAKSLFDGISRGNVSPWLKDEYDEAAAACHVTDSFRNLRDLVRTVIQGMRPVLWALINFNRTETEVEQRSSASGGTASYDRLPLTPGTPFETAAVPSSAGDPSSSTSTATTSFVTIEDVEMDGGPNGLGECSHGVVLSEAELITLRNFAMWSLDALDLYIMSGSASHQDTMEIFEYYASG